MSRIFQLPKQVPIVGGVVSGGAKANFHLTGTTTNTNTYTDAALATPHANPVVADSSGVFATIYLDPDIVYRLILDDTNDALIYDEDPIQDALTQANIGLTLNPRTQAEQDASVTPTNYEFTSNDIRRYGGDPLGVLDSTTAINNALAVYRAAPNFTSFTGLTTNANHEHGQSFVIGPAGKYKTTGTLFFGADDDTGEDYNDQVKNLFFEPGFTIWCQATGLIAVDMAGGYNMRVTNLTVFGHPTNTPLIGIFCARSGTASPNPSAGDHQFVNVRLIGGYDLAAYYNYGSELNKWTNCEFRNPKTGADASVYITTNNAMQKVISSNTTIATNQQSMYGDTFVNCNVRFDPEPFGEISKNFDNTDINISTDRITITTHGFTNNDPVVYTEGTSAITGLTDDDSRFVKVIDANTVELYSDRALATIVNITNAGSGTGHNLKRYKSAAIVYEGTSYGPKWYASYFDLLQGATNSTVVCAMRSTPEAGVTIKRIQGPSFVGCVFENDYDVLIEIDTDVREMTMIDCNMGDGGDTAEIRVNTGAFLRYSNIQLRQGSTALSLVRYTGSGSVFHDRLQAFTDADTTPDVSGNKHWTTANTGATTITQLDGGQIGDEIIIRAGDNNTTITHGTSGSQIDLRGAVNATLSTDDILHLRKDETKTWVEIGGVPAATKQTYTETNVTPDRAFDANSIVIAELADVVGTIIVDLRARGIVG